MTDELLKPLDAATEVLLIDPLTSPIATRISARKWAHPLQFTLLGALLKIAAAISYFLTGFSTVFPPILYLFAVITDSIDGKVARLTGKNIVLHGSLDFLSDQIINSLVFFGMFWAARTQTTLWEAMIFWYILLFIVMSITSTRYRLLSNLGKYNTDDPAQLRAEYETSLRPLVRNRLLGRIFGIYEGVLTKSLKRRLYPHPTLVDSEFVFFIVFPATVAFSPSIGLYLLYLSILLIVPDAIYYFVLSMALTVRLGSIREEDKRAQKLNVSSEA